ncbi:MAG: carboxylating nicotinate-nucleotide diphosphorylase [Thermodesulfobacteriota bacterium]
MKGRRFRKWLAETGGGKRAGYLDFEDLIAASIAEDVGAGDLTTGAIVPRGKRGEALIIAKEGLVVAGLPVAEEVFRQIDRGIAFEPLKEEGEAVGTGAPLARLSGRLASILTGERTALNFLQRLSGIATLTRAFLRGVEGLGVTLLDTRKTTPCHRALERYAVRIGGGENHRFGLFDGILIKDNHIDAVGGIAEAVKRARKRAPAGMKVEVEVRDMGEAKEAVECGADIIMLDNMDTGELRRAVKIIGGRAEVEVSGGVTLRSVAAIARTGVDYISIGSLTHSARAVDMSLTVTVGS